MNSTQRQRFYDDCRADKPFPICGYCGNDVTIGQAWDVAHDPVPRALGGRAVGLWHRMCNHIHNNSVVTPMVAKTKRVRAKHTGAWKARRPMPCGRNSRRSKSMHHGIVTRRTLREKLLDAGILRLEPGGAP